MKTNVTYQDYYVDRLTISELMVKYGKTNGYIKGELSKLGYSEESRTPKRDELYSLYVVQELSTKEIANMYRYKSSGTIRNYINDYQLDDFLYDKYNLNSIQHDIIIGSVLGDGCITKKKSTKSNTYTYAVSHAENQLDYLRIKFNHMKNLCNVGDVVEKKVNKKWGSYNKQKLYWFYTKSLPQFHTYKQMSLEEVLGQLNENSLTVWLMDDGKLTEKYGYWTLGASRFSLDELEFIRRNLKDIFGIDSNVNWLKKDRSKHIGLRFDSANSKIINNIIRSSCLYEDLRRVGFYKIFKGY